MTRGRPRKPIDYTPAKAAGKPLRVPDVDWGGAFGAAPAPPLQIEQVKHDPVAYVKSTGFHPDSLPSYHTTRLAQLAEEMDIDIEDLERLK